jgi:hypothetical protein
MQEVWRPVPGLEGYAVSTYGRVRRLARDKPTRLPQLELKQRRIPSGYLAVDLGPRGARRTCYIHNLVLLAFVGPRPDGHQGCHNDGDKDNNQLENLRWDTPAGNNADKVDHNTHNRGERHGHCRLTNEQIAEIRSSDRSIAELAKQYGYSYGGIWSIAKGKRHVYSVDPAAPAHPAA